MKKITLLLSLLITLIGYSQDNLQDFEAAGAIDGAPFGNLTSATVVTGPSTNTTQVLELVANMAGEVWQGINLDYATNVDLSTTQTMTMDVYSTTPITFLVKVNDGISGAPQAAAEVTHNGNSTWQTLSFTFNTALDNQAAMANGVYQGFVIHAYWAAGATLFSGVTKDTRTFYVDNIKGPAAAPIETCNDGILNNGETQIDCGGPNCNGCPTPPTTAAPMPPARAAADVISIYGESYGTAVGLNNVTWDDPTAATEVMVAGNPTLKVDFDGFLGTSLGAVTDATAMTHFHMDYYIADPFQTGQVFNLKFSNHSGGAGETNAGEYNIALPATGALNQTWISIDVPLTDFTAGISPRAHLTEFLITVAGLINTGYVDNIYFHKNTVLSAGGVDATADFKVYPNPSNNVWNITSSKTITSVTLFNVLGKQVLQVYPNTNSVKVEASNIKTGVYFAKVEGVNGSKTVKLIKE